MSKLLRTLFKPIFNLFESGTEAYVYKASHRKILIVVGALFLVLSLISAAAAVYTRTIDGLFPCSIFFVAGFVCVLVGCVGSDRAVAKIWGSK